jgi:chromosome segregation ATPase
MAEDIEKVKYDRDEYRRKMNIVSGQCQEYEKELKTRDLQIEALLRKIEIMEKDNANIRKVMTDNITQSNTKKQELLDEISGYKKQIRELSAGVPAT